MTSTNAGLCHGNMTWCYEVRGLQYHWVTDLYERINLPILPAIMRALSEAVKLRAAELQKQKSNHSKVLRVQMKVQKTKRPGNSGLNVKPSFTHTGKTTREMMNQGRGQSNCHQQQNLSLWFSFSQKNNPQILPSQHQEIKYICYKFIMPTLVFFWVEY